MSDRSLRLAFVGLTLSSSWGNGHATTFRALLKGLNKQGHDVHFFERDVPWYASHRDLPDPDFCQLHLYNEPAELNGLLDRHGSFDAVIVGSYVPDGVRVIEMLAGRKNGTFCFYDIDTPVTLAKLDAGDQEYLAREQIPLFDLYLSFAGGSVPARIKREFGAPRAEAFYCSVDDALYAPTKETLRWDLGYLGTYSDDRQPALERLLIEPARRCPEMRFVVAGPQYPTDILWPANVERIEHLPPSDHASFYSRQRFTLNVTRQAMVAAGSSPSVRLFEAASCRTPIISDRWKGIEEIFAPDHAILIADTSDDVVSILQSFSEKRRLEVADEAARAVRRHHTGEARAAQLVEMLMSHPRSDRKMHDVREVEVT